MDAICDILADLSIETEMTVTDKKLEMYDTYLAAWSPITDSERLRLLGESVTNGVVFRNPMQTRNGVYDMVEHLEGFQQRSPGGCFRAIAMLGWENQGLATWQFFDAEGKGGFKGYDALTYDEDGRISYILLFGDVQQQKLR